MSRREKRWIFINSARRIEKLRELASQEPAERIASLMRAPNVKCIYDMAAANGISLTAGKRGGPTLAYHFTGEGIENLLSAGAKRGLDRYEIFRKVCDAVFTDKTARVMIANILDDGVSA